MRVQYPRIVDLDDPPRSAKLEMFAADDAYLLDEAGLRHFDGTAWKTIDVPHDVGVAALARGSDHSVWMVTEEGGESSERMLYQWRPDGTWCQRTLPVEHELVPIDVAVHGDALWVTAAEPDFERSEHWALFHSRPRGAVIELPDLETMRRELIDMGVDVPYAGQDDCEVFVPITGRPAGPHLDLQRKLAAVPLEDGATMLLLEVQRDGKPEIGVVLPNGPEIDSILVAALREVLGKRMGTPLCQDMIPRRQLASFP